MFDSSAYKAELTAIYTAYSEWFHAFSAFVESTREKRTLYNAIAFEKAAQQERETLNAARVNAVQKVENARAALLDKIGKNWMVRIASYDEKGVALFGSDYVAPTLEDLEFAARDYYSKNTTMLQALYSIAEKRGLAGDIAQDSPLYMASRQKKIDAANSLADEVRSVMETADPVKLDTRQYIADNFETMEAAKVAIIGNI